MNITKGKVVKVVIWILFGYFAIQFTVDSIISWQSNPYVTSISTKSVQEVPFPAVTICSQSDHKWQALIETFAHLDVNGEAFKLAQHDRIYQRIYNGTFEMIPHVKFWKEDLNRETLEDLGFSIDEHRIFKLIQYGFYVRKSLTESDETSELRDKLVKMFFDAWIHQKNTTEIMDAFKEVVCKGKSCDFMSKANWTECNLVDHIEDDYNSWCENCKDFKLCLDIILNRPKFLDTIAKMSFIKQTLTSKVITSLSVYQMLNNEKPTFQDYFSFLYAKSFPRLFGKFMEKINPWEPSLISIWNYLNGIRNLEGFEKINHQPIQVLIYCLENQNETACKEANEIRQAILKNAEAWKVLPKLFSQPDQDKDPFENAMMIPFCNFGTQSNEMKPCKLFEASKLTLQREKCFTFNYDGNQVTNSTTLLPGNGLNLLLNFQFPGKLSDRNRPLKIILHEPKSFPDTKMFKSNFAYVYPGTQVRLSINPVVSETTSDFDDLSFNKRQCRLKHEEVDYKEVNCLMLTTFGRAFDKCRCIPWYYDAKKEKCTLNGTQCFENHVKEMIKEENPCKAACKSVQYSSSLMDLRPLTNDQHRITEFGPEVEKYIYDDDKYRLQQRFEGGKDDNRLKSIAILDINFGRPEVEVFTKDTKINFSGQIGSIGGTFGMFLGISFLSIIDDLINFFSVLLQKLKNCNQIGIEQIQ